MPNTEADEEEWEPHEELLRSTARMPKRIAESSAMGSRKEYGRTGKTPPEEAFPKDSTPSAHGGAACGTSNNAYGSSHNLHQEERHIGEQEPTRSSPDKSSGEDYQSCRSNPSPDSDACGQPIGDPQRDSSEVPPQQVPARMRNRVTPGARDRETSSELCRRWQAEDEIPNEVGGFKGYHHWPDGSRVPFGERIRPNKFRDNVPPNETTRERFFRLEKAKQQDKFNVNPESMQPGPWEEDSQTPISVRSRGSPRPGPDAFPGIQPRSAHLLYKPSRDPVNASLVDPRSQSSPPSSPGANDVSGESASFRDTASVVLGDMSDEAEPFNSIVEMEESHINSKETRELLRSKGYSEDATPQDIVDPRSKRSDGRFACPLCPDDEEAHTFSTRQNVYIHIRRKHYGLKDRARKPEKPPRRCDLCHQRYRSDKKFRQHLDRLTEGLSACEREQAEARNLRVSRSKHGRWVCDLCGRSYRSKGEFGLHLQLRPGKALSYCETKRATSGTATSLRKTSTSTRARNVLSGSFSRHLSPDTVLARHGHSHDVSNTDELLFEDMLDFPENQWADSSVGNECKNVAPPSLVYSPYRHAIRRTWYCPRQCGMSRKTRIQEVIKHAASCKGRTAESAKAAQVMPYDTIGPQCDLCHYHVSASRIKLHERIHGPDRDEYLLPASIFEDYLAQAAQSRGREAATTTNDSSTGCIAVPKQHDVPELLSFDASQGIAGQGSVSLPPENQFGNNSNLSHGSAAVGGLHQLGTGIATPQNFVPRIPGVLAPGERDNKLQCQGCGKQFRQDYHNKHVKLCKQITQHGVIIRPNAGWHTCYPRPKCLGLAYASNFHLYEHILFTHGREDAAQYLLDHQTTREELSRYTDPGGRPAELAANVCQRCKASDLQFTCDGDRRGCNNCVAWPGQCTYDA